MDALLQDVRYGVRVLRRAPGFTVVALVTLALSVGACTAIFTAVDALFLRAAPYPDADRLAFVWGQRDQGPAGPLPVSLPVALRVAERDRTFERVGTWTSLPDTRFSLTAGGEPEDVQYAVVSAELFELLGAEPVGGRRFGAADDELGAAPVAMISERLWRRRFDASEAAIGRPIVLDGALYTLVGVLPASFRFVEFPRAPDVWLPLGSDPFRDRRFAPVAAMGVVARLAPGVTPAAAQDDLAALAAEIGREFPPLREWTLRLRPLTEQRTAERRPLFAVLAGAVALVLLLACANLANLLLARATAREREIAVRLAMGASRGRMARQLFTESLLLAIAGGAAGVLIAWWGTELLAMLAAGEASPFVPWRVQASDLTLHLRTVAFVLGVSTAAALLFGLGPAWRASRIPLAGGARGAAATTRGQRRARELLIGAQVAIAVVLLTGAGLLVRSFLKLARVDPGFAPDRAVTVELPLSADSYGVPERALAFVARLLASVASQPGVEAAAAGSQLPLGGVAPSTDIRLEGVPPAEAGREPRAEYASISPAWFDAIGGRLLRGRALTAGDDAAAPRVALINEAMARAWFGDADPLGRRVALSFEALRFIAPDRPPEHDFEAAYRTIVGVVADVRQQALDLPPAPAIYVPLAQRPVRSLALVVRGPASAATLEDAVRRAVRTLDPEQPVGRASTLETVVAAATGDSRLRTRVVGAFAAAALLLALVGVYGVVAYAIFRRRRELGIRVALGAGASTVVRLGARAGLMPALAGTAAGLPLAAVTALGMRALLFDVAPIDTATLAAVALMVVAAAALASWLPARRAARIDPGEVLRAD